MATEISFENKNTTVLFESLQVGEKFMQPSNGANKNNVYMKLPNLFSKERDLYLKNAVNISSGIVLEVRDDAKIIPVDLRITVYK